MHPSKTAAQLVSLLRCSPRSATRIMQRTFWQVTAPRAIALRKVALRLFACVAAALAVERLWSSHRLALSHRRRLLNSGRLMLLMYCKMNMHMLEDDAELSNLGVSKLDTNQGFAGV